MARKKKPEMRVPDQYNIRLAMSVSPHVTSDEDVPTIMRDVLIALAPATIGAVYFFGLRALAVIATCVISAMLTEYVCYRAVVKQNPPLEDYSAIVAGLLLAFCLPPGIPLWTAAIGGFCAMFFGKMLFGGLGQNIFNPALVGRAILLASWPVAMTTWQSPVRVDAVTTATPLAIIKEGLDVSAPGFMDLLIGNTGGCLGETSAILLLAGAAYLYFRKLITWRIPFVFIGVVVLGSLLTGRNPMYEFLSGGLILGAFFMATDMVTSPVTKIGRIIFGAGCGLLTLVIRNYGGYPEGVCYAILLMNSTVPLIDRYTVPKVFGEKAKAK